MTVVTTYAPTVEDALVALLAARVNLDGVSVSVGPRGDETFRESDGRDYIQIGLGESNSVSAEEGWSVLGALRREESVTIECEIMAEVSGSNPTAIKAARDRAHELFTEVVTGIVEAVQTVDDALLLSGQMRDILVTRWTEDRGVRSGWRQSRITFAIVYRATLPSV